MIFCIDISNLFCFELFDFHVEPLLCVCVGGGVESESSIELIVLSKSYAKTRAFAWND